MSSQFFYRKKTTHFLNSFLKRALVFFFLSFFPPLPLGTYINSFQFLLRLPWPDLPDNVDVMWNYI